MESIQDYIAKDNPRAAFEVVKRIRVGVNQHDEHPKIGRTGRVRGTYELVISGLSYIVPYRVKGKEVHILNVYHEAQQWPGALE